MWWFGHDARFAEALQLARQRLADRQAGTLLKDIQHLLNASGQLSNPASYLAKIVVKTGRRTVFVSTDTIEWIEASGDYLTLHVGKQVYLIRETLEGLEQSLNPADFVRVHRSTIISRKHLRQLRSLTNRDASALLLDGTELRVSRRYRDRL